MTDTTTPGAADPQAGDATDPTLTASGEGGAALAAATAKAEEAHNQFVRTLAEFDNFRKRAQRDLENAQRYAVERFAQELLPALDGFELALANAAKADVKSLLEGQEATLRLLQKAFDKAGIREVIPAAGSAFDPNQHEAMVAQPSAAHAANSVLETIQKGYVLNGRVLRPARVIVSRAPDA